MWLIEALGALFRPPTGGSGESKAPELSERDKTRIAKAEEKATKLGYEVKIRLAYLGQDQTSAKLNMQALVGTFKQYNSTNLNGFKLTGGSFKIEELDNYRMRQFADRGFILNISELASVYHLPHTSVETPNIVWATSKTAEPPAKLPLITGNAANDENISAFGLTNFRGINHPCIIQTGKPDAKIIIGNHCGFSGVSIVADKEVIIEDYVTVGANAIIGDCDDHSEIYASEPRPVHICNHAWIGMNATIMKGVTIGEYAIVGAGAIVTKDVPPRAIVAGIPAKIIKYRKDG